MIGPQGQGYGLGWGRGTAPVIHKLADIALNYVNCPLAAVHSEHYGQFMHGE